jgi:protein arginine kinase
MKPARPKPKALPKRRKVPVPDTDRIVVDSYFRLERNLADGMFPLHADDATRRKMAERIRAALGRLPKGMQPPKEVKKEASLWAGVRESCFPLEEDEPDLGEGTGLFIGQLGMVRYAIGINQCANLVLWAEHPRGDWEDPALLVSGLARLLGEHLEYAFRPDAGYLTADTGRLGTGLTATALLHLPGLSLRGLVPAVARGLAEIGFGLRHAYGAAEDPHRFGPPAQSAEGAAPGNLYALQNLHHGGRNFSERLVLQVVRRQAEDLCGKELEARERLLEDAPREVADRVARSRSAVLAAYLMPFGEALDHLSMLRLGTETGILPLRHPEALDGIAEELHPEHLKARFAPLDVSRRLRAARAETLRRALKAADGAGKPHSEKE